MRQAKTEEILNEQDSHQQDHVERPDCGTSTTAEEQQNSKQQTVEQRVNIQPNHHRHHRHRQADLRRKMLKDSATKLGNMPTRHYPVMT